MNQHRQTYGLHMAAALAALAGIVLAATFAWQPGGRATLGADGTPVVEPICPAANADEATPAAAGSPAAAVDCAPFGPGTPAAAGGLTVLVTAAQDKAGPVDLTIDVVDAAGEPVVDARVVVLSQHLGMNHGVSADEAFHTGDGRYQANDVSMGMGGTWQVEIQVTRPGEPVVALVIDLELSGPA